MSQPGGSGEAKWVEWVILVGGAVVVSWLVASELAALIAGGHHLLPSPGGVFAGLVGLARHPADPRLGWPAVDRSDLPGGIGYWSVVVLFFGGLGAGSYRVWQWHTTRRGPGGSVGSQRKHRLGADPRARLANRHDVAPLVVDSAKRGRVVLGRLLVEGRPGPLLATEDEGQRAHLSPLRKKHPSRGGRASVVVVGPSRSGKTSGLAVPAILEWDGPVVAVSVKDDLLRDTISARRHRGPVQIFDPRGALGGRHAEVACWSPLRRCGTLAGAVRAAKALAASGPSGGEQHEYWAAKAGQLLAPYMLAAATASLGMGDVVRWVDDQDGVQPPKGEGESGEAEQILMGRPGQDCEIALRQARAVWRLVAATRDGVFATAGAAVSPWADPQTAGSAASADIALDRLMADGGTLYAVAPAHHQRELEPVFLGLLGELFDDAFEAAQRRGGELPRRLLVVLDEAANIAPLRDLPRYASTVAGIGITLVTIFQDLAQVKTRWNDAAPTVLSNHVAKLFLSGISDRDTLDLVSALTGDEEYAQTSRSTGDGRDTTTESVQSRRLVAPDLVRRMPTGQALLLCGSLLPAHLALRPWYKDPKLSALAHPPAIRPDVVADPPPRPASTGLPAGELLP